jgi:hypothetical protein
MSAGPPTGLLKASVGGQIANGPAVPVARAQGHAAAGQFGVLDLGDVGLADAVPAVRKPRKIVQIALRDAPEGIDQLPQPPALDAGEFKCSHVRPPRLEGRHHLANALIGIRLEALLEANLFRPALLCGAGFLLVRQRLEKFFQVRVKHEPLATEFAGFQVARLDQLEKFGLPRVDKPANLAERICLPAPRHFFDIRHDEPPVDEVRGRCAMPDGVCGVYSEGGSSDRPPTGTCSLSVGSSWRVCSRSQASGTGDSVR